MGKTKKSAHSSKLVSRVISEKDFIKDFVFEDADEHNLSLIARIKESNNKYLLYLLTIHNPLFYIYRGVERLNSGVTEEIFLFTYFDGVMVYIFVENVNPGKATFVIQTAITKSDGRNFNYLISQVRSYFSSSVINKRSKLISFELRPFSGFHLGYDRVNHVDFEQWKRLLRTKFFLHKPNAINIIPAKVPACLPTVTIKTQQYVKSKLRENKPIRYIRCGDPKSLIKNKLILLSPDINSTVTHRISSFIRGNGGKIAGSNNSMYDIVIVSARGLLEKPTPILYDISQRIRLYNTPVIVASDLLRRI